jgi:hypothetical protein
MAFNRITGAGGLPGNGGIVNFFIPDKDQGEPAIGPDHAKSYDHITTPYISKHTSDKCKGKYEQQGNNKNE